MHNKVLLASLEWDDVPAIHDALEKAVTHQTKISIKEGQEKQRRQMSEQEQLEEERLLEEERERIVQGDVQERERERMAQEKLAQEQEIERMAQEKLVSWLPLLRQFLTLHLWCSIPGKSPYPFSSRLLMASLELS